VVPRIQRGGAIDRFPFRGGGFRLRPNHLAMRIAFQDFARGTPRPGALRVLGWMLLILGLISGGRLAAQGVVNVNNRGLVPPQLVMTQDGTPLAGTQFVAQIVYGPAPGSLTNKLGDPMPFRSTTSAFPGTWNPGANGIRTLEGYVEGQTVFMQVYVWNTALISGLEDARASVGLYWTCRISGPAADASQAFTYRVGSASEPSSLQLVNFRSFTLIDSRIWPDAYVDDELGGRWLRVVETTEDTPSVTVDLMAIPPRPWYPFFETLPVEFPPDTTGDEPVGSAVRRVTTGNPMSLTGPSTGMGLPQAIASGFIESVQLGAEQSAAETSLVSVEGTIGHTTIRLKRPFVGRVELEMRYPLQDPPLSGGCRSYPRRIVLDVKPSRTPTRVSLSSGARPSLKLRLESGRSHALQRSYDLASWQEVGAYEVGFPLCVPLWPPNCGTHEDPDGVNRFADFEFPLDRWHASNDSRPVFFRVRSQ